MHIRTVYRWEGFKASPIVICLHGFLGSGADFEIIADQIGKKITVVAPNLPDYSDSPRTSFDWPSCITALDTFIRTETQNTPCVLLGYSMGGRMALQYAVRHSTLLAGLVLIGATPGITDPSKRQERLASDRSLAEKLGSQSMETFLESWYNKAIIRSQDTIPEPYRSSMRDRRSQSNKDALKQSLHDLGTGSMKPVWDELTKLDTSTLLVTGEHDHKFHDIAVEMSARIPRVQHLSIKNSGHACCFEEPDTFSAELATFLSSLNET